MGYTRIPSLLEIIVESDISQDRVFSETSTSDCVPITVAFTGGNTSRPPQPLYHPKSEKRFVSLVIVSIISKIAHR